jgi:hypothetical protein
LHAFGKNLELFALAFLQLNARKDRSLLECEFRARVMISRSVSPRWMG